jgi:hypothetical protein
MPRATVDTTAVVKKDLTTLKDGYVVLRKMPYGAKLQRSSEAMKMSMQMKGRGKNKDSKADVEMLQHAATLFDFRHCILEHNLEDETGRTLNLHDATDINNLDPQIGEELSELIDELNNFENDADEKEDFGNGSEPQSS